MTGKTATPNCQRGQSNQAAHASGLLCPLEISPLTLADLAAVMALEKVSFLSPWSLATYHSELTRNRRSRYLKVAPVTGYNPPTLIAQGGVMLFGAEMHIVTIAVQPEWRGRAIGEWLLLALLALGRGEAAQSATLEARVSNEIALRLYRKLNFAEVGYRRRYYPDKEDARILALADLHTSRVWQPLQQRFERLSALMRRGAFSPRRRGTDSEKNG